MAVESVEVAKTIKPEEYPMCRNFLILQVLLRLLAGAAALVAAITMAVNKTTFVYFGLSITAKYNYSGAYEFFVGANSIAFAYAAVSAVFLKLKSSSPKPKSQFLIFFLDLVRFRSLCFELLFLLQHTYTTTTGDAKAGSAKSFSLMQTTQAPPITLWSGLDLQTFELNKTMVALLIAGCSAALAVGYIAKYGNAHAGWIPVCRYMESFCNIGVIAIVFSFGAFLLFYLLAAITMKGPRQIPVASC